MHSTAIQFALKHKISLGRHENGHLSNDTTAKSALAMMRRYLGSHDYHQNQQHPQ